MHHRQLVQIPVHSTETRIVWAVQAGSARAGTLDSRIAFQRLAVFAGGCAWAVTEAVRGQTAGYEGDLAPAVALQTDKRAFHRYPRDMRVGLAG